MPTIVHTDPAPTLDDVWRLFREMALQTERRAKENDQRSQDFDRELKELRQLCKEQNEAAEKRSQEIDKKIKEVSVQIGNLGNRLGEFVEEQVMPSALQLIQDRGIAVHEIQRRVNAKRSGKTTEVDLLLVNDTEIVAIEVKSSLSVAYVDQHVKRLENFKIMFPRYANMRVYGAVAGMVVPEDAKERGLEQGLFVLVPSAEIMTLANDAAFVPRIW